MGSELLTVEKLRALERTLTPEQKLRAFAMAYRDGWEPGSFPPLYCWATYFQRATALQENDD